jgi:prophage regulatory protein
MKPETRREQRILRIRELTRMIGLSRGSVYNRLNPEHEGHDPTFPRPVRLGGWAVGWRADEVEAWLANRPRTRAAVLPPAGNFFSPTGAHRGYPR